MGCHFFLQGIFLTQELNPSPTWQAYSLPSELPGKPASSGENTAKRLCLRGCKFSPEPDWLELWSCTSNLQKSEKINFYSLTHPFCGSPSWVICNIHMNKSQLCLLTSHHKKKMDCRPNIKAKTKTTNTRKYRRIEYLHVVWVGNDFVDKIQKALTIKKKLINWTSPKLRTFILQKTPLRKWKVKSETKENIHTDIYR